eukprot:5957989-Amphidinium_carterae.1
MPSEVSTSVRHDSAGPPATVASNLGYEVSTAVQTDAAGPASTSAEPLKMEANSRTASSYRKHHLMAGPRP